MDKPKIKEFSESSEKHPNQKARRQWQPPSIKDLQSSWDTASGFDCVADGISNTSTTTS